MKTNQNVLERFVEICSPAEFIALINYGDTFFTLSTSMDAPGKFEGYYSFNTYYYLMNGIKYEASLDNNDRDNNIRKIVNKYLDDLFGKDSNLKVFKDTMPCR